MSSGLDAAVVTQLVTHRARLSDCAQGLALPAAMVCVVVRAMWF
jgi:hypothetical protein